MTSDYLKSIQQDLSPVERLSQIVEHAMCIGCGLCQSVAGPELIKMEIVESGNYRPIANDEISHDVMDRILEVCPGTRIEGMPESEINSDSLHDSVWGALSGDILRLVCGA